MTKIVVQPNASGTGTFTIAAPNSNNTRTLTLPDAAGTVFLSDGSNTIQPTNITDGTTTVGTSYVVNGSAKAWVNFNGTGTIAARDSFNVASLTDNGTGDYTVTFSSAMVNAGYCWHHSFVASYQRGVINGASWGQTTANIRFNIRNETNGAAEDEPNVNVSTLGDLS